MKNPSLPIFLSRPNLQERDISNLVQVLKSGNLVQGENVLELERITNNYIDSKSCSAVSNGTASLHLALIALGVGPGDEVIIPALSYIATGNVVELVGATPIFVDVDIDTFNIDVNQIESKITKNTKCIMPVHEFGLCASMEEIMKLSKKHNIPVIEDAACAIGATHNGKFAGTFGDFGSFSLHPRKSITCGEGGLLVSNSVELDDKIKVLRNHGIDLKTTTPKFVAAGYNYRLTDFQAALVLSQFNRIDKIISYKNTLVNYYLDNLRTDIIKLPSEPENYKHTWQTFHILVENNETRDRLKEYLKMNKVFVNYGAQCIPHMDYYKRKYRYDSEKLFPNALRSFECGLALPLDENLTLNEINYICSLINKFV
jgi:dTDP-4-amino-4,6-dideoxygalactose transaminase